MTKPGFIVKGIANRIGNLFVVAVCYIYALKRGTAKRVPANVRGIAVCQNSKLGDMVCMTPIFAALKQKFPDTEITVTGSSINGQLLKGNTDVGHFVVSKKGALFQTVKALRTSRFDVAIVPTPDFKALAAAYLSGAAFVVSPTVVGGWSPNETRMYKTLRRLVETREHRMGSYAPREYLRLLEPLGIMTDLTNKKLVFDGDARVKAEKMLPPGPIYVGVSVGAGNKIKKWKTESFVEVCRHLIEKYDARIVLLGDDRDVADSSIVEAALSETHKAINVAGKLSIEELKAFIARLGLFVSVDTGPIYIAEAFGIPTVDIVGPMDENEQPPRGPRNAIVVPEHRKAPELHIMNARVYNFEEARRQAESITAAQVTKTIDELMIRLK